MKRPWTYKDLSKKTNLPNQKEVQRICAEGKARKLAADREQAEKERQEFIEFIRKHTGVELIAEYRFHPEKKYRMDFCNLEHMISIEVDGGIYMEKSGHNSITGILTSMHKRNEAICMGFRPIHITVQQRYGSEIVEWIKRLAA